VASVAHAHGPSIRAAAVAAASEQQASAVSRSSSANDPALAQATDSAPRLTPRVERDARAPRTLERATDNGDPEKRETRAAVTEAAAPAAGIREELALLEQAQRELSQGNATASLTVLDEHARRFPNGAFSAERTAARVFALCALGQVERARAVGDEFLRSAPASPLVPRIRSSCAGQR